MPRPKVAYPEGADKKLLTRLQKKSVAKRKALAKADHAEFVNNLRAGMNAGNSFGSVFELDRGAIERKVHVLRTAQKKKLLAQKPPAFTPLKSHNPTRYAPFDVTWSQVSGGGITALTPYGPTASTGRTGYSIGIWNGGSMSTVSSVGFWYYSGANATLRVTLNATIWGRAYVFSGLFGYAAAYAGLRLYIEQYSPDFQTWSATNPIYNNNGVLEFDLREFNWVTRSANLTIPVRAQTWYAIWGDAVQSAGAGGIADAVSNFAMYHGPVDYFTC